MKSRVAYFDQMKAVAIILVVVGHLTQFCFGMTGTDVNRWLEIFQMPVFFFISGYFAYKVLTSRRDIFMQLWKKIHSIAIPLLMWCFVWTLTHEGESFIQMLSRCGGKYWFLYTLAILSGFFILYEQLAQKAKKPGLYMAVWGLPFIVLLATKLMGGGNQWMPIDSLANYYRYYLIGFLCGKYEGCIICFFIIRSVMP